VQAAGAAYRRIRVLDARIARWAGQQWVRFRSDARLQRALARVQTLNRYVTARNLMMAAAGIWVFNWVLYMSCGLRGCPDPTQLVAYQPGGASELIDRNGRKFGDLAPVQRQTIKVATLPKHIGNAFIAVEDKRFYQHRGVDWRRVAGAAIANVKLRRAAEGSSTITMQLSRNIFSDRLRASDKSLRRKILEARVARRIERHFSKAEILELYLNHIYFGGGAYGVQAAARYYFDKAASKLDLDEAALLAALPRAPAHYDPRKNRERARARRNLVLELMAAQGLISGDSAERAARRSLGVTPDADRFRGAAPLGAYFADIVRDELETRFGDRVYREKLKVHTTLDRNAQHAVEEELERELRAIESGRYGTFRAPRHAQYDNWTPNGPAYLQSAAVFMESATGDIIALAGGRDYDHSTFNRATNARRQVGSAFKPFVFAAALDHGYVPSQPILDTPFRLVSDGVTWEPRNYDDQFYGAVSMRDALVYSRNIPSVRLAAAVGEDEVARFAREAGLQGEIRDHPMIALGITEATPFELLYAYGAFAGLGTRAQPRFIRRVLDSDGDVIWEDEPETEIAIKPAVAFVITDMLADAVDVGTGTMVRTVGYRGPAAGKTGTTSTGADTWFAGYTPDLVGVVWIGFDQKRALPGNASGGTVAAPAWGRIVERIYEKRPQPEFWTIPKSIVPLNVDPASGLVLEEGCRPKEGAARKELFLTDEEPETTCPAGQPTDRNLIEKIWDFINGLFAESDEAAPDSPDPNLGVVRVAQRGDSDAGSRQRAAHPRNRAERDQDRYERDDDDRGRDRDGDKRKEKRKNKNKDKR
jgi:penicillin-binding protein 1A